jgi:hypothetical protein
MHDLVGQRTNRGGRAAQDPNCDPVITKLEFVAFVYFTSMGKRLCGNLLLVNSALVPTRRC